ncbi:MAG: glycoside hydrolase family 18 protein [Fibrobacter sp.]|nr:glycoside hydrolase family 18 protein [Fibrobacter sp.]
MNRFFVLIISLSLSLSFASPKILGYFPYWAQYSQFTAESIRYPLVTHIHYNYVQPEESGEVVLVDASDEDNLKTLADSCTANNVKLVLSLGGMEAQSALAENSEDEEKATAFAENIHEFVNDYKAHGVEVYWDIEDEEDAQLLSNLLAALVSKLKPESKIVSLALFANADVYAHLEAELLNQLDYITVIAISDMDDSQETLRPNSSGTKIASLAQKLIDQGVQSSKIIPVVPFYGYSFANATGLGSEFDGYGSGNEGYLTYNELMDRFNGTDYKVTYDEVTQSEIAVSSWESIVFNGIPSVKAVAENAKNKSLGGVGAYDLSNDARHPIVSLLVTIGKVLRPEVDYKNIK